MAGRKEERPAGGASNSSRGRAGAQKRGRSSSPSRRAQPDAERPESRSGETPVEETANGGRESGADPQEANVATQGAESHEDSVHDHASKSGGDPSGGHAEAGGDQPSETTPNPLAGAYPLIAGQRYVIELGRGAEFSIGGRYLRAGISLESLRGDVPAFTHLYFKPFAVDLLPAEDSEGVRMELLIRAEAEAARGWAELRGDTRLCVRSHLDSTTIVGSSSWFCQLSLPPGWSDPRM